MLTFIVLFINIDIFFSFESFFPLSSIRLPWFYIFSKNSNYDSLIVILGIKPGTYNLIGLFIIISLLY